MLVNRLRFAGRTALCILIALVGSSCGVLNPSFITQLGGDAGYTIPVPTGSIVLLFNNQKSVAMTVSYEVEITRPGSSTPSTGTYNTTMTNGYVPVTLDCNTTMIKITGVQVAGTAAIPPGEGVTNMAVNEFRPPALQCGSVLFVNVPVFGSPTAELVP